MAALTCSTTKLDQSSGSSLTRMSRGRHFTIKSTQQQSVETEEMSKKIPSNQVYDFTFIIDVNRLSIYVINLDTYIDIFRYQYMYHTQT